VDGLLDRLQGFLAKRLTPASRLWILLSIPCLGGGLLWPLWHINLVAPQYRQGLDLWIYGYRLDAGNEGQDLREINILNHYIGMQPIAESDFVEMTVIPFAIGALALLAARAAVFGLMSKLVDLVALFGYLTLFAFANFLFRLYRYGHDLDPTAPINPDPFWPAILGTKQIANMTTTSLPHGGSYCLMAAMLCLLLALWCSRRAPDRAAGGPC